jgi:hypothetical protein
LFAVAQGGVKDNDIVVRMISYNEMLTIESEEFQLVDIDALLVASGHMDARTNDVLEHFDIPLVVYRNETIIPFYSQVMPNWNTGFRSLLSTPE